MATEYDTTITTQEAEEAANELLAMTDLLSGASESSGWSPYDATHPNVATMLCERALTLERYVRQSNGVDSPPREATNAPAREAGNGDDEAGPETAEVDADSIDSSALRNVLEAIELATSRLDGVAGTLSTSIPLLDRVDQQGDIRPLYLCRDEIERIRGFLDRLTTAMIRAKGRGTWDIPGGAA